MYRGSLLISTSVGKVWWTSNFPLALSFCSGHGRCYQASAAAETTWSTCFPWRGAESRWNLQPHQEAIAFWEPLPAATPSHNTATDFLFFLSLTPHTLLHLSSYQNTFLFFFSVRRKEYNTSRTLATRGNAWISTAPIRPVSKCVLEGQIVRARCSLGT